MKRKAWIVVTACVAAVLICVACLIGVAAHRGIGISKARYVQTAQGYLFLIDGSPVNISGKAEMFLDLTTGDEVLVVHGPIAESYPGQSRAYWCKKQADGTAEDIPKGVLESLRDMGWRIYGWEISEQEAIGIALEHIGKRVVPFREVTAERTKHGTWMVTCVLGNERADLEITSNGRVLMYEHVIVD